MNKRTSGTVVELPRSAPSSELELKAAQSMSLAEADAVELPVIAMVLAAVQAERQRLMRMLHDTLAQSLFVARMRLSAFAQTNTDTAAGDALRLIEQCLVSSAKATRDMMADLSSPLFDAQDLRAIGTPLVHLLDHPLQSKIGKQDPRAALISLSRRFRRLHGLTVTIHGTCLIEPRENLPNELVSAVNELLMNVVKYAGVTRARIQLDSNDRWLRIQVNDEGAGFDATALALRPNAVGGFGLCDIRDRLAAIGGRLKVASAIGRGTNVTLLIPASAAHGRAMLTHSSKGLDMGLIVHP